RAPAGARAPAVAAVPASTVDVSVSIVDRTGAPTDNATVLLARHDLGSVQEVTTTGGKGTVAAAPGDYALLAVVATRGHASLLVAPGLRLAGNPPVPLDARLARPLDITVPDPRAEPASVTATFTLGSSNDAVSLGVFGTSGASVSTAQLG